MAMASPNTTTTSRHQGALSFRPLPRQTGMMTISLWRTASGTWFGETSRQSQAGQVKQQQTGISPNHVQEAVPYWASSPLS